MSKGTLKNRTSILLLINTSCSYIIWICESILTQIDVILLGANYVTRERSITCEGMHTTKHKTVKFKIEY